jgi:hypothetical protein
MSHVLISRHGVCRIEDMGDGDEEEQQLLQPMLEEARSYLQGFGWCEGVDAEYFGMGCGNVFAIFLFEIRNTGFPENHLLWVVVGDIPPAYLRVDANDDPEDALDMYIRMMGAWVDAVEQGKPVDGLIPVNVPPTAEYAEMLGSG